MWLSETRDSFPSQKFGDVAKLGGAIWKGLSEALKKPYEDKASQSKEAYQEALKEWSAKSGADLGRSTPKAKRKAAPKSGPKGKAKAKAEPKGKAKAKAKSKGKAKAKAEPKIKAMGKAAPKSEPE